MTMFSYEKCKLLSAKVNRKRLLDGLAKTPPERTMDFTDILNDIQSLIDSYIYEQNPNKVKIRLYDIYLDERFKEQGISFLKQKDIFIPVLVNLLKSHFGYEAYYGTFMYKDGTASYDKGLTVTIPDDSYKTLK
nr:MAG TPA: hypothetical protein [Caudoviricetes sp.]